VAGDRHGGAPKGERVALAGATTITKRRLSALRPPFEGVSEAKRQSPDAAMRVREREWLFDIVNFESAAVHGSRELGGYPPHPEEGA
jgi:hypothetical protein